MQPHQGVLRGGGDEAVADDRVGLVLGVRLVPARAGQGGACDDPRDRVRDALCADVLAYAPTCSHMRRRARICDGALASDGLVASTHLHRLRSAIAHETGAGVRRKRGDWGDRAGSDVTVREGSDG